MSRTPQLELSELHMFRSYDHHKRLGGPSQSGVQGLASSQTFTSSNAARAKHVSAEDGLTNYGPARRMPIWQVARAATAAFLFFDPLKVEMPGNCDDYQIFTDGGFDQTNNPTAEGLRDIKHRHGPNYIGAVVSVGTAKRNKSAQVSGLRSLYRVLGDKVCDTEKIHHLVEREANEKEFPYFRFNRPNALTVEFDEWEPKERKVKIGRQARVPGSQTMATIRASFTEWASNVDINNDFQTCAEELVERRRERTTDRDRWARYATGAHYPCGVRPSCGKSSYNHRGDFIDHLIEQHDHTPHDAEQVANESKKMWLYRGSASP